MYHGSIQPNNIFVSDDGFRLLIGDFLIPSRWTSMSRKEGSQHRPCIAMALLGG